MSMYQISIMSMHLMRSNRFPPSTTWTQVQQDVAMCDMINLVDSEDAWEEAEMSRTHIAAQQNVTMHADSEDVREVAEMSGGHMSVGEDVVVQDMITAMDSEDVGEGCNGGGKPRAPYFAM